MRPNDAYAHFETEFSYPISRDKIIEAAGDTTVDAPGGPAESVADVLGRADIPTFHSPQDLHETFLANLSDRYVGRKFYDDRGRNFGPNDTMTI